MVGDTLHIFHGVRFFLFGFDAIRKNQIRLKLLEGGGTELSRFGSDCTHLIVDKVVYDDPVCVGARRDGKLVVTSLWVDHSCDGGIMLDVTPIIYRPVRDLNGITGAKSMVVCLTGYQRQDREDIMTMVGLMGATFSKALVASKITHLVCFKFEGEKYELAKKIGKIKLVNHCWLEDCLRAWEILPESDYNKSSYELEIMEAEAKDSEEEREQVPTEPHSGRKVQSPQNLRIERSPRQPSLVESEIFRNNERSSAKKVLAGPDTYNNTASEKKQATTSCSTLGPEGIQNRNPDRPDAIDTHTFGVASGFPANRHAADITPEKARKNLVSPSRTAEKSPSRSSARSNSTRSPMKDGLPVCSPQKKSNPASTLTEDKSTFNVGNGFNLSLSIEEPSETNSAAVKTPVRQHLSHLEQTAKDELLDKRKVDASGRSGTLQNKSDDLAPLARSSYTGGSSKIVGHLSASKATFDFDNPSHEELIEDNRNSSGLVNTNLPQEAGSNSNPKKGRQKMLAKKVLGSSSRLGSWNKKGSIHSSSNSGEKQEETCDPERAKLLNTFGDRILSATIQNNNIHESRPETTTKARPLDDETETPDDEADAFYVASHRDELDPLTSERDISASGGANNDDEIMGGNELIETDKERGKCDAVCNSGAEVCEKEHTTSERMDKGRKRPSSKTKEHAEVDVNNADAQEEAPKKVQTINKGRKRPLSKTKKHAEVDVIDGDAQGVAPQKEQTTAEVINKGRKRPLSKTKKHAEVDVIEGDAQEEAPQKEQTTAEVINKGKKGPLSKTKKHAEVDVIEGDAQEEAPQKEQTTAEIVTKGRKRPLLKTQKHDVVDAVNEDTQEKVPKKIKNDGKATKKGTSSPTTSGRAKGDDQVISGNLEFTVNKENSNSGAEEVQERTSMENNTAEIMENPRKGPLTKRKNQQNMKKSENNRETLGSVSKVVASNEQTENRENKSSTTASQSKISAQEKLLSSLQVEKENTPVISPVKGDEKHSGKGISGKGISKSKQNPDQTELKGTASNGGPGLAEHVTKVEEPVCFLLSGHRLQRKEFQQVIRRLRGRVCRDSHNWSYQATHLILPDPIRRTEKFFAAVASGRWVLKTYYLTASNEAGKFLDEHPFEWHKNSLTEDGSINLVAPQKWRLIRERTGHGAFHGMRVIVYGECIAPPLDTLKRAVKAGDGTILATSPPYTRFLESGVDYAIVSPGMPRVDIWVQEFLRHEIPCVSADYLVEYVCKPGYSLDKHVQYGTHSWAEKSLKNMASRMEEIVEDRALPEDSDSESDIACQVCESRDREEVMLICGDESGSSGCGIGMHIDCCDPPLSKVPLEDWFCPKCIPAEIQTTKKPRGKKK